ncbi:MAG: hypothetical protein A2277_21495 [Desulfobacterales bacterium RIFOXYA12_FULL_46_15]|nr:MAG: hypothetical protein A2277_21495 [Desulfobacterales bacterium RIFOXYA12_FULL_46_15]
MKKFFKTNHKDIIFTLVVFISMVIILCLPDSNTFTRQKTEFEARCEVVETDDTYVFQRGIFKQGEQRVKIRLTTGEDKGRVLDSVNLLQGAVELEWFYKKGEKAITGYSKSDGVIISSRLLDPVRIDTLMILFFLFFITVIAVTGWVGVKSVLSFVFTLVTLWKLLIPGLLNNRMDPVLLSVIGVGVLSFVIIFLVAGFTKKGWIALLGVISGCLISWAVLFIFSKQLNINGTTSGFSTTLRFSGFETLDLLKLYYASVIISASGAIMDIAMDISAALCEIKEKRPDITRMNLIKSGINIGRSVIGTMTTTLLLAYTGTSLTMLMLMAAKGISISRLLNMNHIVSELLTALSGTFGLTLVAPITAVIAGWILVGKQQD